MCVQTSTSDYLPFLGLRVGVVTGQAVVDL